MLRCSAGPLRRRILAPALGRASHPVGCCGHKNRARQRKKDLNWAELRNEHERDEKGDLCEIRIAFRWVEVGIRKRSYFVFVLARVGVNARYEVPGMGDVLNRARITILNK
jgi:hypothetical protein